MLNLHVIVWIMFLMCAKLLRDWTSKLRAIYWIQWNPNIRVCVAVFPLNPFLSLSLGIGLRPVPSFLCLALHLVVVFLCVFPGYQACTVWDECACFPRQCVFQTKEARVKQEQLVHTDLKRERKKACIQTNSLGFAYILNEYVLSKNVKKRKETEGKLLWKSHVGNRIEWALKEKTDCGSPQRLYSNLNL